MQICTSPKFHQALVDNWIMGLTAVLLGRSELVVAIRINKLKYLFNNRIIMIKFVLCWVHPIIIFHLPARQQYWVFRIFWHLAVNYCLPVLLCFHSNPNLTFQRDLGASFVFSLLPSGSFRHWYDDEKRMYKQWSSTSLDQMKWKCNHNNQNGALSIDCIIWFLIHYWYLDLKLLLRCAHGLP